MKRLTRKEFEHMYRTMTIKDMSQQLNISTTTIYNIIRDMNIKKKGKKQIWRKIIVED